jgi:PD-(D/E)XK endonuclease
MTPKYSLYLGETGQASATSYFLARGWNVATPKVDVGDDLVVIEDDQGFFVRIQVKTAQAIERKESFVCDLKSHSNNFKSSTIQNCTICSWCIGKKIGNTKSLFRVLLYCQNFLKMP